LFLFLSVYVHIINNLFKNQFFVYHLLDKYSNSHGDCSSIRYCLLSDTHIRTQSKVVKNKTKLDNSVLKKKSFPTMNLCLWSIQSYKWTISVVTVSLITQNLLRPSKRLPPKPNNSNNNPKRIVSLKQKKNYARANVIILIIQKSS
jgi:hypothetical protein